MLAEIGSFFIWVYLSFSAAITLTIAREMAFKQEVRWPLVCLLPSAA